MDSITLFYLLNLFRIQPNFMIFLNILAIRPIACFISISTSFQNFLCPVHILLNS